jgi:hypothetical protein
MKYREINNYHRDEHRVELAIKATVDALAKWLLKVILIYLPVTLLAAFLIFCVLVYFLV